MRSLVAAVVLSLTACHGPAYYSARSHGRTHAEAVEADRQDFARQRAAQYEAQARMNRILIVTGPVQQPQTILGAVHGDTGGWWSPGGISTITLFELLRAQAFQEWGSMVDAVVNVAVTRDSAGNLVGDGIAVHFTTPDEAQQ